MNATTTLTDALVAQKNELLSTINAADDWELLRRAMRALEFATPVWIACEYGYKVREMKDRIVAKAEYMIEQEETYLEGCRKNCRTRNSTERSIRELKDIKACMS